MHTLKIIIIFACCAGVLLATLYMTAKDPLVFINMPSILLVLGGTIVATMISYPYKTIRQALKESWNQIFLSQNSHNMQERIKLYSETVSTLKQGALHEAEQKIGTIDSPYLEMAAQMLIDGNTIDDINKVLNWRLERKRSSDQNNAMVFRTMAAYAPAFGMIGTLIGLVNMLDMMEAGDFSTIGPNMAVALITTFYGVLLANIVFKPIAVKLEQRSSEDVVMLSVAKEAVMLLSQGKPPAYTRELLNKYLERK
ncbi:MAG: MotA/TolQ/ExbB proton channel family protein [Pseudobdellovibrionaceae bacterium]|jgi:chemotaxis protein MotA|nr:MotA/TolQ/ExbB proton channel family protein [Pseudobdellovibrionaceae bacterium]